MSDVFERRPGEDRLEVEISAALAARVHRRARVSVWSGRIALMGALVLAFVATAVIVLEARRGAVPVFGIGLSVLALLAAVAAVVLAGAARSRTRRLLAASAPEGGIVIGLSSEGVHLAHLPLLEWSVVTSVCVADKASRHGRAVTVGLAVTDVGATRARVIDARLTHLVRPFPRSDPRWRRTNDRPGFLTVSLGDLLDDATIDEAIRRLESEATSRGIPFHRVSDARDLVAVLSGG
ncbi:hypothetical protein ELQ92_12840 [Labedella populi]|uniref:Uncharacterized protein n=1 Tax=Labedella populi TaxID=2498850 RepID=A0A444Q6Z8_9MICO|nr:hypothetical protein [Labedella populi]RWZ59695.1 hypothetical protein ELQ92_12840 [Labedella populi]